MNELQILKAGHPDNIDILNDSELENVRGGDTINCKKGYSTDSHEHITECSCGYIIKTDGPYPAD